MTVQDYSENENISGLKGYHYRRVFTGKYDRKTGLPKYRYKIIVDGKYVKGILQSDNDTWDPNNKRLNHVIPDSVLNYRIVGDKKEIRIKKNAPGNKRWTETAYAIWNGNDFVMPGDPSLVPDNVGDSPSGGGPVEEIVEGGDGGLVDNSTSFEFDGGNIFNSDLKIDWTGNLGEGIYDGGPTDDLKIARNNSMPSTKWANTAEGDYYTFQNKMYKKGSVTAQRTDNILAAKERAKQMARLRIQNKGV